MDRSQIGGREIAVLFAKQHRKSPQEMRRILNLPADRSRSNSAGRKRDSVSPRRSPRASPSPRRSPRGSPSPRRSQRGSPSPRRASTSPNRKLFAAAFNRHSLDINRALVRAQTEEELERSLHAETGTGKEALHFNSIKNVS
uniref:Uncharacterized protein n=1 Tax=Hyaloperonospora arabidopsidis (strain Emoy2) TaxID=559515 RepID=M4C5X0_HYAAE